MEARPVIEDFKLELKRDLPVADGSPKWKPLWGRCSVLQCAPFQSEELD